LKQKRDTTKFRILYYQMTEASAVP